MDEDPLCQQWVNVSLGADTCKALVARELCGPARHDSDRTFEFLITGDRDWSREPRAACWLGASDRAVAYPWAAPGFTKRPGRLLRQTVNIPTSQLR